MITDDEPFSLDFVEFFVHLLSPTSTEYFPKVLGYLQNHQDIFLKNGVCVYFGQQWFCRWNSPICGQAYSYIM